MTNYIQDYALESTKAFNVFDQHSFINSASVALKKDGSNISFAFPSNHCTQCCVLCTVSTGYPDVTTAGFCFFNLMFCNR